MITYHFLRITLAGSLFKAIPLNLSKRDSVLRSAFPKFLDLLQEFFTHAITAGRNPVTHRQSYLCDVTVLPKMLFLILLHLNPRIVRCRLTQENKENYRSHNWDEIDENPCPIFTCIAQTPYQQSERRN